MICHASISANLKRTKGSGFRNTGSPLHSIFAIRVVVITLFILATGFRILNAQQVTVSARLDTNAMLIGDHVGFRLQFSGPPQARVIWPFMPDTILGNINVIGRGKLDTTWTADKKGMTLSQEFTITSFDSGFYTIPPITFGYRIAPDTSLLESTSQLLTLMVHTIKVDTTQAIKPIAGPLRVPITFREILPWILLAAGAIALVIAGVWFYLRRKKNKPVFQLKPAVVLLPHEIALREMEQLRVKKLWQSGKIKEYYSELTEIIRRYIENRFGVQALEQTSTEILDSLRELENCPRPVTEKLAPMLILADMVKFAKAQPLPVDNEQSLNTGIEFVYETTGSSSSTT